MLASFFASQLSDGFSCLAFGARKKPKGANSTGKKPALPPKVTTADSWDLFTKATPRFVYRGDAYQLDSRMAEIEAKQQGRARADFGIDKRSKHKYGSSRAVLYTSGNKDSAHAYALHRKAHRQRGESSKGQKMYLWTMELDPKARIFNFDALVKAIAKPLELPALNRTKKTKKK